MSVEEKLKTLDKFSGIYYSRPGAIVMFERGDVIKHIEHHYVLKDDVKDTLDEYINEIEKDRDEL